MKVLITPRSFAKTDEGARELLLKRGLELVNNPSGSIMSEEQMKEAIEDCDGVILGVDPLNAAVLEKAAKLKAVAKYGVGLDNIDEEICARRGIKVSRTVGANSAAVADYTFALMLALARKVIQIDGKCRKSDWSKITTTDVSGKTLGLIGLGSVGKEVVKRAKGFSMNIKANDKYWDEAYSAENGIMKAEIDEIIETCDFVSLHVPLSDETRNIISAARLSKMKPTAFLINTSRGGLIDENALIEALTNGKIAGAGLDVFSKEPPDNKEWFNLQNVVIGSHCGASTVGASESMGRMAAENLIKDLGV